MKFLFLIFLNLSLNLSYSQVNQSIYTPVDLVFNDSSYSNLYNYEYIENSSVMDESIFFSSQIADSILENKTKWYKSDPGKAYIASGALIGLGLFTYKDSGFLNRQDARDNINRYLSEFHYPLDDYI